MNYWAQRAVERTKFWRLGRLWLDENIRGALVTGQPAAGYLNKKFFENLENKKGRTRLMKETETLKKYNGASIYKFCNQNDVAYIAESFK